MILRNLDTLRFFAIFFMIYGHFDYDSIMNPDIPIHDDPRRFLFVISDMLRILAAPFLGAVAGYFSVELINRGTYKKLVEKKWRTLITPFLVWNTAFIAVQLVKFYVGENLLGVTFASAPPDMHSPGAILRLYNFIGLPANFPLHYIQDLFILNLALPIFLYAAKHLRLLLPILCFLCLVYVPIHLTSILPRSDLAAFFGLGVYAYLHRDAAGAFLKTRAASILAAATFLAYILVVWGYFVPEDTHTNKPILFGLSSVEALRLCASFCLLWVAANWPVWRCGVERHVTRGDIFRAYCMHAIVISVFWPFIKIASHKLDNVAATYLMTLSFPALVFAVAIATGRMQGFIKNRPRPLPSA